MAAYDNERITLSTGRHLRPNRGIVGIGPTLDVFEGYDDELALQAPDGESFVSFTPEDRRALADIIIARWERWAQEGSPP